MSARGPDVGGREAPEVEVARLRREKAAADRRLTRLRGLARLSAVIASSLDLHQVLSEIARAAAELMEAPAVGLWVADEAARTLEPRAFSDERLARTYTRDRIGFHEGLPGWVATHRQTLSVPDVFTDGRLLAVDWFRQHGLRSAYVVPIVHQDLLLGVLAMNGRAPFDLDAEDRELLETFVGQAALAMRNARLFEEARGTRDFLRSIAEHSPAGIVTTDMRGCITYWSPRAEELLGYRPDEVLGRPVAELQRGGLEAARAVMRRLRAEDRIREYEAEVLARDGRWLECRFSIALLRDATGETVGTLAILEDTSERKRLEAQLRQAQKMEAVGRLAGGIAHDFNNLLAVIMGHSDLILSVLRKGDAMTHDVEQIRRASERAATLTRQLLAFSRRQFLQPQVIDVNTLVANLTTMLRRLIGENIQLELRPDPEAGRVSADPGQLEQVVVNLAVNARDAMPQGGRLTLETASVTLDPAFVAAHPGSSAGGHVRLSIQDAGCGMGPEVLSHLFEPFFTTKEPGHGTGLGLSTVYGIVKQHRGYIDVTSEPGRGSTFAVYLPRVAAEPAAERPAPREQIGPGGRETVLFVEDEIALRDLMHRVLAKGGYTVLAAGDGLEALALVEAHAGPIDLVVTDVILPRMSGPELAARLRARNPGIRLLYLSGYTADQFRYAQTDLGADAMLLAKPFTSEGLLHKVREVLDQPTPPVP
jgi:two-component system cell cycle sensor histidine kinase/response regulator CckA